MSLTTAEEVYEQVVKTLPAEEQRKLAERITLDLSTRSENDSEGNEPYPLRGSVLRYDDPMEPVAQEDWEALI